MAVALIRPIDICDVCDGLLPLTQITPTIKVLKFKRRRQGSIKIRPHEGACTEQWDKEHGHT